ncbi:hypothetical protein D5R93_02250 [Actinomyces lilanjuaniae]|uniref:Uncharacterized protein n=1 Tax=Actinomyces lilanjuaniae TaxID=2321394 RepID=A0ABM6Z1L4_9ACTO|nr:hypothetical protein [Actinomyces lilanjuaniae]AYD89169.1 hypothetical protein D5R93_02250 [Actinomyces lilanjuaniae]
MSTESASRLYLTSPAGPAVVETTDAGVETAVAEGLPEQARQAVRSLVPLPQRPQGLTAVEGEAAWEGDVVADWDQAAQEVAWSVVGHPARSSSLQSFGDDLAAAWADHAASLAAAGPVVDRLRGLAPTGLDPAEAVVTWDPQTRQARMDVNLPAWAGPDGTAPGVRVSLTTSEGQDEDVVVRIEGDGHPQGTSMTPDQAREVVAQAVRDATSTPADVARRALEPAMETLASLPGMGGIAVEDPVLLEDGSLSVQLHPSWDGPSTETAVTLTAPGDGGPVTVRAGGPLTAALRSGQASPDRLAEDAWVTGVSPDLATQPDPTRISDARAAALVLGVPQASLTQAVDTLSVGLETARQAAWDAAQGARPAATQRFRHQQAHGA